MTNKPIIKQSLSDKADERERSAVGRIMAAVSNALVGIGLLISAILTTIYLMLLVQEAAGLPDPYGYLFGFLVGIVAIVPAELAMVIWKSRLDSDSNITGGQRVAAVAALILAGIFSSLTTSSFFSYSLPQLFPAGYLEIAPTLNVGAIVGSWIVFLMAVVAYSIFSRQTQQNLAQAKAQQGVFDARMSVIRSAGEAIRAEADNWIDRMDEYGVFGEDAKRLISNVLNMEDDRLSLPAPTQPPTPTAHPNGSVNKTEQTSPPPPIVDGRANNQPAYQVWLHNGRRPIHLIEETYDWAEADSEARQAAAAAPPEHYIIIVLGEGIVAKYPSPNAVESHAPEAVIESRNGRPTQRP